MPNVGDSISEASRSPGMTQAVDAGRERLLRGSDGRDPHQDAIAIVADRIADRPCHEGVRCHDVGGAGLDRATCLDDRGDRHGQRTPAASAHLAEERVAFGGCRDEHAGSHREAAGEGARPTPQVRLGQRDGQAIPGATVQRGTGRDEEGVDASDLAGGIERGT